jgi:hypothetical protein
MHMLAAVTAALVVAWAVLVVVAQVYNPDQSPLAMGMSGLARGRAPWVMKSSFIVRGLSALALVAALPSDLRSGLALAGVVLLWVWGVGSAALALADTDMPGEAPTPAGAAHALIAMVAYIAGVGGAILLSSTMLHHDLLSGVAIWALPIAVTAAAALAVQFVAFGAAAREAQSGPPAAGMVLPAGTLAPAGTPDPAGTPAPAEPVTAGEPAQPVVAPQLVAGVPPQLGSDTGARTAAARQARTATAQWTRPAGDPNATGMLHDLACYAGLYQRIFVGLLMAWTLLVALRLLSF